MTRRLDPREKERRAFQRSLRKMSASEREQALRDREWFIRGLHKRTAGETAEFLAMIERRGVEAEARGKRILASYVENDERLQADVKARGAWSRWPGDASKPMPHGTPLASRVAARTALLGEQIIDPTWRLEEEDARPDIIKHPWWRFWRR